MSSKKDPRKDHERIALSLSKALPGMDGDYEMSSAFSLPERRKLLGEWIVTEHLEGGRKFIERFAEQAVKGIGIVNPRYEARYHFKDGICIKRVLIDGLVPLPTGSVTYEYRLSVALTWDLEPGGVVRARPELGYQSTSLDGAPAGMRELEDRRDPVRISYRIEGDELVLEEGEDRKRLRKNR